MGLGVLTSRRQANLEMALAEQRGRDDCCGKPPSSPQGGVTGARPATGNSSGRPLPRQSELHPRAPQGQIARFTGNTPCGPDSSQNFEQQGHTGNPADMQPSLINLISNPVSPYQPNPLEISDVGRRCKCPNPTAGSLPSPTYQQGYQEGVRRFNQGETYVGDDRSEVPNGQAGTPAGDDYMQGLFDGIKEGGTGETPSPGYDFTYNPQDRSINPAGLVGRRRVLNLSVGHSRGNLRPGVNRRGALGY